MLHRAKRKQERFWGVIETILIGTVSEEHRTFYQRRIADIDAEILEIQAELNKKAEYQKQYLREGIREAQEHKKKEARRRARALDRWLNWH